MWSGRTIHEITRRDVNELLDRIVSRGSPVTANRALAAIRKMFSWAVSKDIVKTSPCEGVTRPFEETARDRALTDDELRLVWRGAEAVGRPFHELVKLLILTLQRRDEVGEMRRSELRMQEHSWVIPKERVKNGQEHEVPLSAAAISIFQSLPQIGRSGFLFTTTGEAPASGFSRVKRRLDFEILKLQKADAIKRGENPDTVKPLPHWTLHDLRRTGASGMAKLGIPMHVVEKILNHTSGSFGGVAGVYQRYNFADEKKNALDAWASHVESLVTGKRPANVISLASAMRL